MADQKQDFPVTLKTELNDVISEKDLEIFYGYLKTVKYGTVTFQIHDGKVVLIEKTEKTKINR